jgi:hypothetical protein
LRARQSARLERLGRADVQRDDRPALPRELPERVGVDGEHRRAPRVKDPKDKEARWAELVRVTKEIHALEPVLLAPDAQVVSRESSNGVVRALGKAMPDGNRYLFADNTRNSPTRVTWTLAAPAAEAFDLSTGKTAKVDDAAITTELAPYEVRRVRLR